MLAKRVKKEVEPKKFIKTEKSESGVKKPKQKKKKRLIIRNLSFKVDEAELKKVFSKFGNVVDVKIPKKQDGRKKGFGFVEFNNTKSLIQAMKSMNYKEILGRKVAVDFAVDKTTYQLKVQSLREKNKTSKDGSGLATSKTKSEGMSEDEDDEDEDDEDEDVKVKQEESEDEDEKKLNAFLKEFDSGADALTKSKSPQKDDASDSSSDESSVEDPSDDESENDEEEECLTTQKGKRKFNDMKDTSSKKLKKDSRDISEGKTVFIRNVSFTSTEDSLRAALEEYGECEYCLLCMDQFTDHPKGTAFIKFKDKSSADRLVEESIKEPGVILDGRKLSCSLAISRDEVTRLGDETKKPKDKRNLNLLRVGLIMANSKESEGVSPADMSRRSQLERSKKMKLKNLNYFVSDTRLMIHNLPKNYSDGALRKLFKNAAGPGSIITEARVMKQFNKTDAEGNPESKGFGFVAFKDHKDALTALRKLNNNPDVFTPQKRPIVEFTVENRVAIQTQEKRKEKAQLRNKKRTEEKKERQLQQLKEDAEKSSNQKGNPKKKQNKAEKKPENINQDHQSETNQINKTAENSPKRKQKKRGRSNKERKEKNKASLKSKQTDVSDLVHKYKDKLKNKIT